MVREATNPEVGTDEWDTKYAMVCIAHEALDRVHATLSRVKADEPLYPVTVGITVCNEVELVAIIEAIRKEGGLVGDSKVELEDECYRSVCGVS